MMQHEALLLAADLLLQWLLDLDLKAFLKPLLGLHFVQRVVVSETHSLGAFDGELASSKLALHRVHLLEIGEDQVGVPDVREDVLVVGQAH